MAPVTKALQELFAVAAAESAAAAEQAARVAAEQRADSPELGKRLFSDTFAEAEAWRRIEINKLYANMTAEDWRTAARWKQYSAPDAPERTCAQPLPQQLLDDISGLSAALARQPLLALTNVSRTMYLALLTFHSTGLEGNTLTLQETVLTVQGASLRAGLHPRVQHTPATAASIEEASNSALLWHGLGLAELPGAGPHPQPLAHLALTGLVGMNAAITRGTGTSAGLRTRHVAIGRMHTMLPLPDEVPVLVHEFLAWLRGSAASAAAAAAPQVEATLALACNAHTRFVFIHPFMDGNGRTARTLSALALQHSGLPAPMIPRQRRSEYMAAVSSATMARDYAPLALMHAQAVRHSLSCLAELLWGQGGGSGGAGLAAEQAMAARGGGCRAGSEPPV